MGIHQSNKAISKLNIPTRPKQWPHFCPAPNGKEKSPAPVQPGRKCRLEDPPNLPAVSQKDWRTKTRSQKLWSFPKLLYDVEGCWRAISPTVLFCETYRNLKERTLSSLELARLPRETWNCSSVDVLHTEPNVPLAIKCNGRFKTDQKVSGPKKGREIHLLKFISYPFHAYIHSITPVMWFLFTAQATSRVFPQKCDTRMAGICLEPPYWPQESGEHHIPALVRITSKSFPWVEAHVKQTGYKGSLQIHFCC